MRLPYVFVLGLPLLAAVALAQTPAQQQPVPAPVPVPLHQMDDVLKSLNLNESQMQRLSQLTEQAQARYRADYAKLKGLKEAERLNVLNRQYASDWLKGARSVFNDEQFRRYKQLQYQYAGFGSLADPEVQQQLNLTEEQ